jgi:hypothetical protein
MLKKPTMACGFSLREIDGRTFSRDELYSAEQGDYSGPMSVTVTISTGCAYRRHTLAVRHRLSPQRAMGQTSRAIRKS